ncbi:OVARIAN TUMOR DOMAIN-containing deubiquitinating enzyme 3-like [Bidens hawaiensis]|uniref:OVARIAN TUMOR DOMAIN-containing deubiquitinating enzyme 3-like n=1 Tax=Bidens hawaiensis TaxID=980011 RepID=UPI00404ABC60
MLAGVISSRPAHYTLPARHRHIPSDATFPIKLLLPAPELTGLRRCVNYHSSTIELNFSVSDIWHAILPTGNNNGNNNILRPAGEGSWNVAWDVRPARWLHRPYTAWLLFGICACLAAPPVVEISGEPTVEIGGTGSEPVGADDIKINSNCINNNFAESSLNYRITGVSSDGRCLFRAIAHLVCLRNGEEAPDDNKQRELADELRAQVVSELVKRRKEIEWFIEDDFDLYIKMIEKPYIWGGEPELLMASHVLKTTISVFMVEETTKKLLHISTYGKEYEKDDESPIKLLFHGYGHYDILEDI